MKELHIRIDRCFDLKHELEKTAVANRIDVRKLTFDVVGVHTIVKEGERERQLSLEKAIEFFASEEYQKECYEVIQAYDIVVRRLVKEDELLDFDLALEKENSQLVLTCSDVVYERFDSMLEWLHKKINTQKSLLGVVFEDPSLAYSVVDFRQTLEAFDARSPELRKICIARSRTFIPRTDEYFEFITQENWELKHKNSFENSFYAVKEGMEVGRKHKICEGTEGRDLLGGFVTLPLRDPEQIEFSVAEIDFQIKEEEQYFSYIVLKDGYVGKSALGITLIKDLSFGEINARNFGNLLGGIEYGFVLNVRAESIDKDAIGAGIIIEAQTINVSGDIGEGVILRAEECRLKGSVHQSSEVYATEATISNHRGKFVGKNVVIGNCEGGVVICESAEIAEVVGGDICGREIKVNKLHTNAKIRISKLLEIEEMLGGGNILTIDSAGFWKNKEKIEKILWRYERFKNKIQFLEKMYRQEISRAKKMKPMVEQFKTILIENTQRGLQTQSYVLETIKDYFKLSAKIKAIRSKILALQEEASFVYADLEPISDLTLDAKVVSLSPWKKHNQVEYINVAREIRESLELAEGERVAILIDPKRYTMIKERL